jgi:hypothetical protein
VTFPPIPTGPRPHPGARGSTCTCLSPSAAIGAAMSGYVPDPCPLHQPKAHAAAARDRAVDEANAERARLRGALAEADAERAAEATARADAANHPRPNGGLPLNASRAEFARLLGFTDADPDDAA